MTAHGRAPRPRVVVMGVSGSGKSTLAQRLADHLAVPLVEGDDLHPESSRRQMADGVPLTDADRLPWLGAVRDQAAALSGGCVITCSALRRSYRDVLRSAGPDVLFLQLDVPSTTLRSRLTARTDHFMSASLLTSQLSTLEPLGADEPGSRLDGAQHPDDVLAQAVAAIDHATHPETT